MELSYDQAAGMSNALYYNGNISAIKWKGPGEGGGASGQRSYKFSYDKTDRLTAATFQKYGTAWDQEVNGLNETQGYDHNGNILAMTRKKIKREIGSGFAVTTSAETIDNLAYTYASTTANQLEKVEDTGTGVGFINGVTQTTEYTYNTDGSQTSDANKGIASITYNELGKPAVITYSGSPAKTVTYTYDAAGTKIRMVTYDGTNTTTTDYVGGFVYENSSLSFFSSPEGRIVKNGANFEYQYAIGDHQGNTRVVFSSQAPAPVISTATFEDDTQTEEQSAFQNYPTGGNRSSLELFDHTDFSGSTYNKSQLLNGGNNSQVGLAKSFKVYAGDVIKAEVYAKYWNATSTTSNISGFAAALVGAFGLTGATTGEALLAKNALESSGSLIAAGNGNSPEPSAPKAFITVLLFDQNYNFVEAAYDGITTAGEQVGANPKGAFDLLSREVTVKEPGYVFIYISNENPTQVDVYFDDLKIEYQRGHVIQYNEYYPFGMQNQNSWTREGAKGNQFLFNGGTEENSLTALYDLPFRNYDPVLGRMNQVDPMSDKYGGLSPYNFSFNDPVYWNDPSGADANTKYYESYGGGGCGCWRDKGAQDYGGEARGANLYSTANWDNLVYGSVGGGSAFGMFGNTFYGNAAYHEQQMALLDAARKGDPMALQSYASQHAQSSTGFTGHLDFISGIFDDGEGLVNLTSFWTAHFLSGKYIGATSYAHSNVSWYLYNYPNAQAQGNGTGDPPAKESEFNITFTFGLVAGLNAGDYFSGEVRVWTFGEVGTKTDFDDEEWNDGKITSEHSISGGFGSLTFGRGFEHRIGHRDYGGFYDTHPKDIYTSWGYTTKVDRVTGEQERATKTVIFGLGLGLFSFEITKDPR